MPLILGLDASIRKAGFCVVDTDAPPFTIVERGRLYTTVADGIPIQRLLKQQKQIRELLERHSIDFVSMEAPYFGDGESERLYALNQFLHAVFLDRGTFVIAFPPQQLKKLAIPEKYSDEVHKPPDHRSRQFRSMHSGQNHLVVLFLGQTHEKTSDTFQTDYYP